MMETLLDKVQKIEQEISTRLKQVGEKSKAQLSDLLSAEPAVLDGIRQKAERKAVAIIKEYEAAAEAEVNVLRQDQQRTVAAVKEQAEKNQARTVKQALQLFEEKYLVAP